MPDGQKTGDLKANIMKKVEDAFTPEFINRIDDIIVFTPLTEKEVAEIAELYLNTIKKNMQKLGKELVITEAAMTVLVEKGYSPKYGARFLKRVIDDEVKVPVTLKWKDGDRFTIDLCDGEICVEAAAPATT
jgi:ATP-dependent Clp protease ATP-binding subunit ClpA